MSLRRAAGNLGYLFSALFPARGLIGFQPIGASDELPDDELVDKIESYVARSCAWHREIDGLLEHQGRTPRVTGNRGLGPSERDAEWIDREGDRWRWNPKPGVWQNKINRTGVSTGWYSVPTEDGTTSPEYAPYREIVSADGRGSGKDVGQRAEEPSGAYRPSCPTSPSVDDPESIDSACARFINGLLSGDLAAAAAASEVIYDRLVEWVNQVLDAVYPQASSAAGEASATDNHDRGPSAEERPAPDADSPGAGHPTLSSGDLKNAAYAVRGFAEGHGCTVLPDEWNALADRLSQASEFQK